MRTEAEYLDDIAEAVDAIKRFIEGHTEETFAADDLVRSAVLQKLMIIGEAVANMSDTLKEKYPQVPWHQIKGFRNLVVHTYFRISWKIVWTTATIDVPELGAHITSIIQLEYPD